MPVFAHAQAAPAPNGRCILEFENTGKTRLTSTKLPSGQYNSYIGGGVVAHCRVQNMTLIADSAEYYGDQGVLYLIDNVHYSEPRVLLDSQRLTYWEVDQRLLAEQNVLVRSPAGSTLRGPNVEYLRSTPQRPRTQMTATGRPTLTVVQQDTVTHKPGDTVTVIANRIVQVADTFVYASGRVEISRPDVLAKSDSAYMDGGKEFARLMHTPSIQGKNASRPYTLIGATIELYSNHRQLQRVLSMAGARAISQDVVLDADTIDMRVERNLLQNAYAWGASQAHAKSSTQTVIADSIHVVMPDQKLRDMRALRNAYAEGTPDSVRIRTTERDWLRGDTIIAHFDTLAHTEAHDSSSKPRIRTLDAIGQARAFYHIADKAGVDKPSVNYVKGKAITVLFDKQAVQAVAVQGEAVGIFIEAVDSTSKKKPAPADSTRTPGVRP